MSRRVTGRVVQGHRVASGLAPDSPYPAGTIAMQIPVFAARGLDLSPYFPATINLDVSPLRIRVVDPMIRLERIRWCEEHPPETFSFCNCRIVFRETAYDGMIYHPDPGTKKMHFQSDHIVEMLAPLIPGLEYGSKIALVVGDGVRFI